MNSLSYLSRQFDVLASSSTPLTPPSTPTGESLPEADSIYPQPYLKRIRSWAFGRAFFLPQQLTPPRRHTHQPIRARKRSGSTPSSSRFQLSPSSPASGPSLDASLATEPSALAPISSLTQQAMSSLPAPQSKVVASRELGWIRKLYFLQVIFLFANWLYTIWKGLSRPIRYESRFAKGKGVEREDSYASPETSSDAKNTEVDAVRIRQTRSKASPDRTSYVRSRASSIINIALRPQTKPPTPSPLSQPAASRPPTFNLIPPDTPEDEEFNLRGDNAPVPLVASPTSTLSPTFSPSCVTPTIKRTTQVFTTRASSPAKPTPLHTRKTLVLDLDETLIHSTTRPMLPSRSSGWFNLGSLIGFGRNRKAGHIVEVVMGGRSTLYHVYKRPFVDYFLRKVSRLTRKHFQIATSSHSR